MTRNIHGLDRNIPENIRRQVRQECGFGCVICGLAITQYEHIDPTFADAKFHDPKKIALLCGTCHDHITRGTWSKDYVLRARRNPKTFQQGCARDAFDFRNPFHLFVGDSHFQNVRCIVRKSSGEEWFTVEPPEAPEGPPRLTAKFFCSKGLVELEILQNEWFCPTGVWDLKVEGPVIEVRSAPREIVLRLKAKPPHGLEIQRLKMLFKGTGIEVKNDGTTRLVVNGTEIEMNTSEVSNADAIFTVP
jgi:hypothetical protein